MGEEDDDERDREVGPPQALLWVLLRGRAPEPLALEVIGALEGCKGGLSHLSKRRRAARARRARRR